MKAITRGVLPGLIASVMLVVAVPAAQAATEFGPEILMAGNCTEKYEACGSDPLTGPYAFPKDPTEAEAKIEGYTQADGHPSWGVTAFKVNTEGELPNAVPAGLLTTGPVKRVRTDVGPGVSTNPEAVPKCTMEQFGEKEAIPNTGFYGEPKCEAASEIGVNKVTVYTGPKPFPEGGDVPIEGKVYNLVQPQGVASVFGVALKLPTPLTGASLKKGFEEAEEKGAKPGEGGFPSLPEQAFLEAQQYYAHTLINGNVEWAGDYHDYYEIDVSTAIPLISSRLVLKGNIGSTGNGGYITLPSNCASVGPATTSTVTIESEAGQIEKKEYTTPIGTEGCLGESPFEAVPFQPKFSLGSGSGESASDQPDGITTEVVIPHDPSPTGIDTSQVKTATIVLPEGMTLNPSAAKGLKACSSSEIGIGTRNKVECPEASEIGKVTLTVPQLPMNESLAGSVYLGGTEPITAPPYTIYVRAVSERYGVDVRLKGTVTPNPSTGQLTTTFTENPEQPFSDLSLKFKGGPQAPIANPLTCGMATAATSFVPFTGTAAQSPISGFVIDSNGKGGACGAPILALTQSTASSSSTAGAYTSFALNLERGDGQQYLTKVSTTLPEGLLGAIPSLTLCGEAEATAVSCPANSKIGTATIKAGAGSEPYSFSGQVFMTGPYNGAPYGMEIVVPTAAGPFDFHNEIVRATVNVNPSTTQLTVTASVPTIKDGIPLRIKGMTVAVEREKFLFNPTNCNVLSTSSSLSGTPTLPVVSGATQGISTPFQVNGCSGLPFKPTFSAATSAKTSKANGASLKVNVGYPTGPQANIKSVRVELPKQLPSRLTTLNKACTEAQFNANPAGCPSASNVGTAIATTPVLPGKLTGPAYLVSHGGAAFPDLEMVLSADNVTVVLDGQTNIKNGITSSTFNAIPDAPVSGFELNLPTGKYSVFTANGNICAQPLVMPTVIEGQNGAKVTQSTKIAVTGCGVVITAHKVKSHRVKVTVVTPAAGRVSASGKYLKTVKRTLRKGSKATVTASLSKNGLAALRRSKKGKLKVKVVVGFRPTKGSTSKASVTVTFKR
jgi:hypothetical protein